MRWPSHPRSMWAVFPLVALAAGWMLFDGLRALIVGDYVTPSSGEYAGQLGPWADLVAAIGIEPRSTFMKSVFVAYGAAWLSVAGVQVAAPRRSTQWALAGLAAGSLWYLWIGTLVASAQLVLLGWALRRPAAGSHA